VFSKVKRILADGVYWLAMTALAVNGEADDAGFHGRSERT